MSPPGAKETPPEAVPAATEGKEKDERTTHLSISDNLKFQRERKSWVHDQERGIRIRKTRNGFQLRIGGAW